MAKYQKFFCAFCKSPRSANLKKHVGAFEIFGFAVLGLVAMFGYFGTWEPRVLFLYILIICLAEMVAQFRWRMNIVCPECGFDPVVYKRDAKAACEAVKAHMENPAVKRSSLAAPLLAGRARKKPLAARSEAQLLSKRM